MQFCIGTIKDDFLGLIGDPGGATWKRLRDFISFTLFIRVAWIASFLKLPPTYVVV